MVQIHRIDSAFATVDNLFDNQTKLTPHWFNSIQEEIAYTIEQSGITLDVRGTDTRTQLYEALCAMGAAAPLTTSYTLTQNLTLTQGYGHEHTYFIDGGSASRNIVMSGTWSDGFRLFIFNKGNSYPLVFDSAGIASSIAPQTLGLFLYDSTEGTWR